VGIPRALYVIGLLCLLAGIDGCTRAFYRRQADNEVNDILAEKDRYADWKIEQYHVYPDPRARFADPTNPDRPPMPPDDEATWKLSPHPQYPGCPGVGMVEGTGYLEMIKVWDEQNRAERVAATEALLRKSLEQNRSDVSGAAPYTRPIGPIQSYFDEPLTAAQMGFLLKVDQSVELGVVNSRDYQRFREELYLAALPVTLERFSFAYQWAATENAVRMWAGPLSPIGPQNNWTLTTTPSATKLFSTGAMLTASFANTVVFNFTGPGGFSSSSLINLNLVQPLLAGGGKAVTLEPLTQAERSLVYDIRAYARFRGQFFLSVVIGSSLPGDLATFAGTTPTGSPISVLAALGIASTDVSGGFVGYLSTLFRECDMAADKKWVHDLDKAVRLFEGLQEGGQVSPLQVDQVKSTLLQAQNTVLVDQQNVTNAVDQFKLVLGLPANLPLILEDTPARDITRQFDRYYEVIDDADAAYKLVELQEQLPPNELRAFLLKLYTTHQLVQNTEFQKKLPGSWENWAKTADNDLKARIEKLGQQRRMLLDQKTDLEMKGQTLTPEDARILSEADFESDLGGLEQILRRYEARPWEKQAKEEQQRQDKSKLFRLVAYASELVLVWARNERFTHVGDLWPALIPAHLEQFDLVTSDVDKAQEVAVGAALQSRWDLMNARAQVVDAWRQLRVTANALMGVFNVGYNLQSQTPPGNNNPFAFSPAGTAQQLSLNFQLPLNRLAQRNAYRTAIINYQIARRSLMGLEDSIAAQVRFDVRQLQLFANNYRIQKKVIQSLYSQVESALEVIVAPADPDQLKATGTTGAANAAALTNQYLTALSQLDNAQTKMYDIWLSFLATRMQLYFDLERLPLDNRGVWTDESGEALTTPPTVIGNPTNGGAFLPDDQRRAGQTPEPWRPIRLLPPAALPRVE
jgi:outer membrane protein TolC